MPPCCTRSPRPPTYPWCCTPACVRNYPDPLMINQLFGGGLRSAGSRSAPAHQPATTTRCSSTHGPPHPQLPTVTTPACSRTGGRHDRVLDHERSPAHEDLPATARRPRNGRSPLGVVVRDWPRHGVVPLFLRPFQQPGESLAAEHLEGELRGVAL